MGDGRKKALFLDRDGVINIDAGYVHRPALFEFMPGIFELCRAAQNSGYLLIVVTNQAGIARGYYSEADFRDLTDWMKHRFLENGVHIARVYHCPYHPVFGEGPYKRESHDRKPNPGMLLRAQSDFNLDLASSLLVGDKFSDIEAARAAGVGVPILLQLPKPRPEANTGSDHAFESLEQIRLRFFPTDEDSDGRTHPVRASSPRACEQG